MSGIRVFWLLAGLVVYFVGVPISGYGQGATKDMPIAYAPSKDPPAKIENGFQIFWRNAESPDSFHVRKSDLEAIVRVF